MNKIESELREWFAYMQNKYTWLTIKYEYSEWRECFLVSLSPTSEISKDWDFCDEKMDFTDKLHDEFGDEAPLFCNDESLFELSDKAIVLPCKNSHITIGDIELVPISLPVDIGDMVTAIQDSHKESVNDEIYYNNKDIAA